MIDMGTAGDRSGGWPERGRRFAASPHAPAVAGALLGLAAMTEAIARGAGTGMSAVGLVGVCALALITTVPLAFLGPVAAAVAICAASVLSLAAFQTLTVAGLAALLIALVPAGPQRRSTEQVAGEPRPRGMRPSSWRRPWPCRSWCWRWPAPGARAPRKASWSCCWPRWPRRPPWPGSRSGRAARRWCTAQARQVIAGTLVEHTARGERARIARELHDVVAHHISMIAVQAETARLATPGMPAAGAQRLLEIGDTARAGLTEMRRLLGVLREDAQAADPGQARCRPPSPARPAAAQRVARRGQGCVRHGHQAHHFRAPGHPRSRRRAGRLPHRPGSAHQRPAARAGRRRRRGTALRG